MEVNGKVFQSQRVSGDSWTIGEITITPQSHVMAVRLPFGGFIWNRPVAVVVEKAGESERIPILDVTRIAMLMTAAVGFTLAWTFRLTGRRKRN